jgi:hypothetical protein
MKKLRNPFMITGIILGFVLSSSTLQCSMSAKNLFWDQQILNQELGDPARAQLYNYELFCLMLQGFVHVANQIEEYPKDMRTKHGLVLAYTMHPDYISHSLYTPWGKVRLTKNISPSANKIATTFFGLEAHFEPDLDMPIGPKNTIFRWIHDVNSIGNCSLPQPEIADDSDGITLEDRKTAWKILKARFDMEHPEILRVALKTVLALKQEKKSSRKQHHEQCLLS